MPGVWLVSRRGTRVGRKRYRIRVALLLLTVTHVVSSMMRFDVIDRFLGLVSHPPIVSLREQQALSDLCAGRRTQKVNGVTPIRPDKIEVPHGNRESL